ncbi:MAG: hypothetical protein HWD62_00310 [Cyclobacteriaceae bacterium]|nr:MAG: hypothetical protein HWD62_00310 [Cyclobacteriaceae bacterium]
MRGSGIATKLHGIYILSRFSRFVGNQFEIPANLPTSIKRVGVFVNENLDQVQALVQKHRLDFVQLHGDEPVGYAEALQK